METKQTPAPDYNVEQLKLTEDQIAERILNEIKKGEL